MSINKKESLQGQEVSLENRKENLTNGLFREVLNLGLEK